MFALQRKQWKIICQRGHQSAGLKQQRQRKEQGGGQALAGSRDFKSAKISGFLKLKSRDFSGFLSPCFGPPGTLLRQKSPKLPKICLTFYKGNPVPKNPGIWQNPVPWIPPCERQRWSICSFPSTGMVDQEILSPGARFVDPLLIKWIDAQPSSQDEHTTGNSVLMRQHRVQNIAGRKK